jgi:putative membrane protein
MEDLPEEVAAFADEYNVTVIDPHHSFSPTCKKLREEEISAVMRLAKECALVGGGWRGSLRFSVAQSGVGSARYDQGIGPCGYSFLGLEIGGKKVALAVVDGNNALPHLRCALTSSLKEQGWEQAELITTDTHTVNGVILGGRGYVAVGEKISQEEVVETFSKLSKETLESLEEAEAKYLRVVHRGVMIYTDEAFRSLARRVRRHAALYLGLLIFTAVCAGLFSIL